MDWPISWQKVKDSGVAIFDIADYGLRLDPINPVITDNVAIMYDVEKALNDGKTVYLKSDITSMQFNGYAVLPITMYTFSNGLGDKLARICAAGLVPDPSMNTPSFLLAVNFLGRYGSSSKLSTVTMTTHRFVEEGSGNGLPVVDLSSVAVATGINTNIEDENVNILNAYSKAGKNLTAKIKFIDPTDSENEVTQVVGLNLMVTNHTTNGTTTTAYVGTAAGMFFHVYKEDSHWVYSVTQQSQSETTNPSV